MSQQQFGPSNSVQMEQNTISDDIERVYGQIVEHTISIHDVILFLETTQFTIIQELVKWKHHQRLAMYGDRTIVVNGNLVPFANNLQDDLQLQFRKLNQIQEWQDGLAKIINATLESILFICPYDEIAVKKNEISRLIDTLIKTSIIVLQQPPRVIKKGTRYAE